LPDVDDSLSTAGEEVHQWCIELRWLVDAKRVDAKRGGGGGISSVALAEAVAQLTLERAGEVW
jgi:hypothetical protein